MQSDPAPQAQPAIFDVERRMAQEQIAAAWQLHVEALQEQLDRGWRDHIRAALDERFASLEATFEEEVERRVAGRLAEESGRSIASALRHLSERLNQTARRLEQADTGDAWAAAVLDGAFAFAPRVILFSVIGGELQYEDHRALGATRLASLGDVRIPVASAAAFAGVLETMDTVIAIATPGELSMPVAVALGGSEDQRVCLLPVIAGQSEGRRRVAAILYAEGGADALDINLLEIVTALAGSTLDSRQAAQRAVTAAPAGSLLGIAPVLTMPGAAPPSPPGAEPSAWGELSREEQELHAKAQRFARVRVAEMRLYQAHAVRKGREQSILYSALRGEMDRGRAQFRHEFMRIPSMIDYFHQEVVRTLANDDPSLLGEDYPGPLV